MKIIAHRGYSKSYPENTALAIQKAIEAGVDMIETDVRLSRDFIPVLFHDDTLDRCTNTSGRLEEHTLKDILKLDAGIWFSKEFKNQKIPTLAELIKIVDKRAKLILELKYQADNCNSLCREVTKQIIGKESWIEVSSFDDEILDLIHKIDSSLVLHKLIEEKTVFDYTDFHKRYKKISYFDIDVNLKEHPMTKLLIKSSNVIFWTVDGYDISSEVKEGLYGAMANDPTILKKYL